MVNRAVQAATVSHEYQKFPAEAPGFAAEIDSLQDLWDAVHSQPNVAADAHLVVETPSPAGGTWWQRWANIPELPSSEVDPIKVKVIVPRPPRRSARDRSTKGGKQGAAAGAPQGGRKQQRGGAGAASAAAPEKGQLPESMLVVEAEEEEESDNLLRAHLAELAANVKQKDAKLDLVENAMIDSAENDKKVAAYSRVQERLAEHAKLVREHQHTLLLAMLEAGEDEGGGQEVAYEESIMERFAFETTPGGDDDEY